MVLLLTPEFAQQFAREWAASWNARDLDRILSHYTDDFSLETPLAAKIVPESKGVLKGKESIRKYWALGLAQIPDLKFEIIEVLTGINTITVYYRNLAREKRVAEIFWFNENGKVYKSVVCYS